MYEELVKRLREESEIERWLQPHSANETPKLLDDAADAIEELSSAGSIYGKAWTLGYDAGRDENKPRWIPVTERLPEHLQSVLVHRDDGGVFIYEYFDTSPTDDCWIDDSCHVYSLYNITHWMPLPEQPKEEA